ncbi:MAG: hypothetical protein IJM98_00865 [Oscillospiraceae bacterium]|nr:hypothetical protein [Oscillospiraceae bacterium]
MDLVGAKVKHKAFGSGTITAFESLKTEGTSGYVTVKFTEKTSKFLYPDAFGKFIFLEDEEANAKIVSAVEDEQKAKKKEQQEHIDIIRETLKRRTERAEKETKWTKSRSTHKTLDDFFGKDYHSEKLKREPILGYRQVESSFGIRIAGFGRGINPTETAVILISSIGKSSGKFVYHDRWTSEGDYIYSGEGKTGDQTMTGGNLAIRTAAEEKKDIHLFVKFSPQEYYYQGIFDLSDYTLEEEKDENGNSRMEYKFRLTPKK